MRIRISSRYTGAIQRIVRTNVCNLRRDEPARLHGRPARLRAEGSRGYFQVFLQNMRLGNTSKKIARPPPLQSGVKMRILFSCPRSGRWPWLDRQEAARMIARINGTVEAVSQEAILVNVGELGYEVLVPAGDIAHLQTRVGQRISLFTMQYIEGNASFGQLAPRLLGFLREQDRDFFMLFTTVKGIGTRRALRAIAAPVAQIAAAIVRQDTHFLTSLPEIGKRTAERIIAELSGRVDIYAGPSVPAVEVQRTEEQRQAIAALTALGERRAEAENWVDRACRVDPALAHSADIVKAAYKLKGGGG